jgi:hypothetical protein
MVTKGAEIAETDNLSTFALMPSEPVWTPIYATPDLQRCVGSSGSSSFVTCACSTAQWPRSRTTTGISRLTASAGCRSIAFSYVILLLLSSGDIQPNPGPALQSKPQVNPHECLQAQALNTVSNGHCLLHAVQISIRNFLALNIPLDYIINSVQFELIYE